MRGVERHGDGGVTSCGTSERWLGPSSSRGPPLARSDALLVSTALGSHRENDSDTPRAPPLNPIGPPPSPTSIQSEWELVVASVVDMEIVVVAVVVAVVILVAELV